MIMIIAKVLVAFWYGFNVMELSVSKMLSLAGQVSEVLRYRRAMICTYEAPWLHKQLSI